MRTLALLLVLCFVVVVVLGQSLCAPPAQNSAGSFSVPESHANEEIRMRSRAHIEVVPIILLVSNKAELQSLRARVAEAEAETGKLEVSDPAVREQFSRQLQLLRALLSLAEMQQADAGKSPTALEVQEHLNNIEGQTQCDACHGRIVLKSNSEAGLLEP